LFLRIGNDGVDLKTGEPLMPLRLRLDTSRQAESDRPAEAGSHYRSRQRHGVDCAEGALAQATLITLTPLGASPLLGVVAPLPWGEAEPEGSVSSGQLR
jgi:hypothetical protein